jgi:hypothetical protein
VSAAKASVKLVCKAKVPLPRMSLPVGHFGNSPVALA